MTPEYPEPSPRDEEAEVQYLLGQVDVDTDAGPTTQDLEDERALQNDPLARLSSAPDPPEPSPRDEEAEVQYLLGLLDADMEVCGGGLVGVDTDAGPTTQDLEDEHALQNDPLARLSSAPGPPEPSPRDEEAEVQYLLGLLDADMEVGGGEGMAHLTEEQVSMLGGVLAGSLHQTAWPPRRQRSSDDNMELLFQRAGCVVVPNCGKGDCWWLALRLWTGSGPDAWRERVSKWCRVQPDDLRALAADIATPNCPTTERHANACAQACGDILPEGDAVYHIPASVGVLFKHGRAPSLTSIPDIIRHSQDSGCPLLRYTEPSGKGAAGHFEGVLCCHGGVVITPALASPNRSAAPPMLGGMEPVDLRPDEVSYHHIEALYARMCHRLASRRRTAVRRRQGPPRRRMHTTPVRPSRAAILADVERLQHFGFDEDSCRTALGMFDGDVKRAARHLFQTQRSRTPRASSVPLASEQQRCGQRLAACEPGTRRALADQFASATNQTSVVDVSGDWFARAVALPSGSRRSSILVPLCLAAAGLSRAQSADILRAHGRGIVEWSSCVRSLRESRPRTPLELSSVMSLLLRQAAADGERIDERDRNVFCENPMEGSVDTLHIRSDGPRSCSQ